MATDYANPGGTGDRQASITVTAAAFQNGTPSNLVDGATANNGTDSCSFFNASGANWIKFDFGAGVFKIIDEIRWRQSTTASHGTNGWYVIASLDNEAWMVLAGPFTLGGATTQLIALSSGGAIAGFRYFALWQFSQTAASNPWLQEVEFQIDAGAATVIDAETPSYDNAAARGPFRSPLMTLTTTFGISSGAAQNLVSGYFPGVVSATHSLALTNGQATGEIKVDFGLDKLKRITEITWRQRGNANTGQWQTEGSSDDTNWAAIGSAFTLTNAPTIVVDLSANADGWRYYRLRKTGVGNNTNSSTDYREIEFKIGEIPSTPAGGAKRGNAIMMIATG